MPQLPPRRRDRLGTRVAALLTGLLLAVGAQTATAAPAPTWIGTWGTSSTSVPASANTVFQDQTLRQIVHTSVGGSTLRVRLSNEFGSQPLVVGEAHVARSASEGSDARVEPGSDRRITFGGKPTATVPAGAPLLSDPVALPVRPGADLVISLYLPERTPATTVHGSPFQDGFLTSGNATGSTDFDSPTVLPQWYFLSGVRVAGEPRRGGTVVAFGDSITDGAITTPGANRRWPDFLARRFQADRGLRHLGVVNSGIGGNRLLHDPNPPEGSPAQDYAAYFGQSALRRFDRDVLLQPGVRHVVVLIGVNDLGHPGNIAPISEKVTAHDLIAGYRQLIARAHERGVEIHGATITPFRGDTLGFYNPDNEAVRQQVNHWIRTSGEYDGYVDFDAAVRDPRQPDRLLPAYDSGDHLHPNDAGMEAMANSVPLRLFR
ncbi:SGNH/GDSL hydrolase family protein [Saccharothrix coeruleofusca]|uniref:SGNH hydrolase-type esterase domain-containing protein n=1 Tax=Saccharothrix coeruleofusca TaxID=33919 RepID=A0A918ATR3_9PSEU|nr:SGNH/GDSL hydrolase family protein [Saccharothrix coeruleofusca]MBP2336914.1 lysophospholipase L1-like esterase [Saccharothrix coeruleofusca]GGP81942.1 hypothetical protein GCM10010185_64970 [Saccharothrix coeruleofusca]